MTVIAPPDLQRYLVRLGVPKPQGATAEVLGDLTRAHIQRVPFENVLIQLDRPAALRPATTIARIARGGGGYCFELNGAFGALLQTLGFEVRRHPGSCWIDEPDPPSAPVNHLALTVRCVDGSWWLVEVGMSDAVCEPIPLAEGKYTQGPFTYEMQKLDGPGGRGWRFHHDPFGSFGGMDFTSTAPGAEVIERAHRRLSTAPDSPFTRLLSVGRRDTSGAEVLRGRVLIRWDAEGHKQSRYDDADKWFELLSTHFGLPISQLATTDRDGLWARVVAAHAAWAARTSST